MSTKIVEGFSVTRAAILDGSTGAEQSWGQFYGCRDGALTLNEGNFDNTGDDVILSSWFWFNYAEVSVKSGYIPFDLIANMAGSTVTSSGTAPNDFYYLPLWNEGLFNTPRRPMLIRCLSKDSAGSVRTLDIVLYNVQFSPMKFEGPTYKQGLVTDYGGRCLLSSTDEKGASLTERAIGRLISYAG